VSALRESIANPTEFLLENRADPFEFMIKSEAPSGGNSVTTPGGDTQNYYPWGLEHAIRIDARAPGYLVRYCFPVDNTEYLLALCLDRTLDPAYRLMTGADKGEDVCRLVARHWPHTFKLLQNGNGMTVYPGLMRLSTARSKQFAVATFFTDDSPSPELKIPAAVINDLTSSAFRALEEVLGWPHNIPGLVEVLGGPDRLSAGLEDAAQGLDFLKSVLEHFR
jgi:hypothetical protein